MWPSILRRQVWRNFRMLSMTERGVTSVETLMGNILNNFHDKLFLWTLAFSFKNFCLINFQAQCVCAYNSTMNIRSTILLHFLCSTQIFGSHHYHIKLYLWTQWQLPLVFNTNFFLSAQLKWDNCKVIP
jgi:hypothetical protein